MLQKKHQKARLRFARTHKKWSCEKWGTILFSDETKFNLYSPDGGNYVYRPPGKRYDTRYTQKTVKFGAGSQMAWGMAKKMKILKF
jgi:hypothetical protein